MSKSTRKQTSELSPALSQALPDADKQALQGLIDSYKKQPSNRALKIQESRPNPIFDSLVSVTQKLDSIKQFKLSHYDELSSSTLFLSASNIKRLKMFDESYATTGMEKSPTATDKILLMSEENYGVAVKNIRKSKKLSQNKLALLASVSVLSIKKIEKGVGNPSLKTVLKINEVLNLKLAMI